MADAITFVITPFSVLMSWADVPNYDQYSIYFKQPSDIVYDIFDVAVFYNSCIVHDLVPETEYVFQIYTTVAGVKSLTYESHVTTSSASLSNVSKTAFVKGSYYTVTSLTDYAAGVIGSSKAAIVSTLFDTDEILEVITSEGKFNTKLLKLNGSTQIQGNQKLYIPFDDNYSGQQSVTITKTDNSDQVISYSSESNSIMVSGTEYIVGEQFQLDGKLVTVASA
jgi:hypothetical protein